MTLLSHIYTVAAAFSINVKLSSIVTPIKFTFAPWPKQLGSFLIIAVTHNKSIQVHP
jgi:hypothetical protein